MTQCFPTNLQTMETGSPVGRCTETKWTVFYSCSVLELIAQIDRSWFTMWHKTGTAGTVL